MKDSWGQRLVPQNHVYLWHLLAIPEAENDTPPNTFRVRTAVNPMHKSQKLGHS